MRFRAKLVEAGSMRQFSNIMTTLSKLSKNCILRICSDRICFIIPEEHSIPYKLSVWCILYKNAFFAAYDMVGDSEKNEIYLEISSDMLASSLSSIKAAGSSVMSLKIKLTHKVSPCITLELELASTTNTQMCIHDVPVSVMSQQDWVDYQEPQIANFNISIQMPNTRVLKNIVDKLKKINSKVIITAKSNGSLSLLVKATTASIETHFKDLNVKKAETNAESSSVCVDIRKLSQFLTCDAINPNTMVCNIVSDHMMHLCLAHTGFQLNYYLVAVDE